MRISGTILFGFDLECLHVIRTTNKKTINRKRPYDELTSKSQKNKRLVLAAKDINSKISNVLQDHKLLSTTNINNNTFLKTATFDIIGESVKFDFCSSQNENKIRDSIVRACDENLISRDGYRRLAAVNPDIEREYAIEDRRAFIEKKMNDIIPIYTFDIETSVDSDIDCNNTQEDIENIEFNDNEIGNCVHRSIISLLYILVPILLTSNPHVLNYGDTINLKLGGDGRNVGRSQNHVMLTVCILNEGENVLKPDHQYW